MVKVITIVYNGKEYVVADIQDVISCSNSRLLIGSLTLNQVLYDEEKGYCDSIAEAIDEQIYAYLDEKYFLLEDSCFLSKVKELLD